MKRLVVSSAALWLAVFVAVPASRAQLPSGTLNAAFTRLFGTNAAFTAKADVQVLDGSQKESLRMPMNLAVLGDRIRVDTDMTRMKSKDLPANVVADYKQKGLERVSSVIRPDKKAMYILFPGVKGFVEEPVDGPAADLRIDKAPQGRETIDGHPAVKNRTLIRDAKGLVILDATTWNAEDLKEFPVQIATQENGSTTIMRFQQIQFARPDVNLFEPPAGYEKHLTSQDLIYAASKKNESGGSTKK